MRGTKVLFFFPDGCVQIKIECLCFSLKKIFFENGSTPGVFYSHVVL